MLSIKSKYENYENLILEKKSRTIKIVFANCKKFLCYHKFTISGFIILTINNNSN